MKGQPFNRVTDTKIIQMVSDSPGILSSEISSKSEVPVKTIQIKIKRLCDEKRIFKQTKKATNGNVFPLYTMSYARKNKIPRIFVEKDEMNTLEQQMWFTDLLRAAL